jgi:hypothetical protein
VLSTNAGFVRTPAGPSCPVMGLLAAWIRPHR